jgi:hypothetical protein
MKPRTEKILSDIFGKDATLQKLSFLYEKIVDKGRILSFGDYHKGNLYILKSIASGQEFNETQRRLQNEWDRIRDERNQPYSQVEEVYRKLRIAITDW